ncbi:MAG: hypothetical protein R6U68_13860 [Desulfobacteraceae bacterium]
MVLFFINIFPVQGDVYKYKDKNGDIVYTNDLTKVPLEQRRSGPFMEEIQQYQDSEEKRGKKPLTEDRKKTQQNKNIQFEKKRKALLERKAALADELKKLQAKKIVLEEENKTLKTADHRKAFVKKVEKYNKRIELYNKEKDALDKEIEKFNQE